MENSDLITRALAYIRKESGKSDITPEDIAFHAGFSTDYFNRIFTAHTGFRLMEYVRFTRLLKATRLLRLTEKDILNIALDCGYESPESFARAFKKQYGKTPVEYRTDMRTTEAYYSDFRMDTVGSRIAHEFPGFRIVPLDEAIDFLLEHDAIRHGYAAVCMRVNGGAVLCESERLEDGFIWFTDWAEYGFSHIWEGEIFSDDYDVIARYLRLFSDGRFSMSFYSMDTMEVMGEELQSRGVSAREIARIPQQIYRGGGIPCTPPSGYSVTEITYADMDELARYYAGYRDFPKQRTEHIRRELYQRDVLGCGDHSVFLFAVRRDGEMVGTACGGLQRVHGFVINNCIETSLRPDCESEELYRYVFAFVTNAALEKGALPLDDLQYEGGKRRSGRFCSTELGYETVTALCRVVY